MVRYTDLGALALLAEIPPETTRANPDVAALTRLVGAREDAADAEALDTLDAYCTTGSLRRAADLLHLHHSTVARRLDHLGNALNLDLTDPTGLARARLALVAWRLLEG